jgi:hypothetical protein
MAVQLQVIPIVDGEPIDAEFTIDLPEEDERRSVVYERAIRVDDGVRTYAPRGTWLSVRFLMSELAAGDLIIDGVSVDYDILTPTKIRA